MNHPFPLESVNIFRGLYKKQRILYPKFFDISKKRTKFNIAWSIYKNEKDASYGFADNLFTGIYAPWPHESTIHQVSTYNCTTIIPRIYLEAEENSLNPKIVQFINFRDVKKERKHSGYRNKSHFAIIIDIGRKNKYLIDPFWDKFGPILEHKENYISIGKNGESKAVRREFREILYYTPEEFASMIERMKDPAESLDMLIAGQKIYNKKPIDKFQCSLMLFYNENENSLETRLHIPQFGILNKAIYCNIFLDHEGNINKTNLRFAIGKDVEWTKLEEERTIARTDFPTIAKIKKLLKNQENGHTTKIINGIEISDSNSLIKIANEMWNCLSLEERTAIEPMVFSRTLYENISSEYLYTKSEHDEYIRALFNKVEKLNKEMLEFITKLKLHKWKIDKLDKKKFSELNRKYYKLYKIMDETQNELGDILNFRYGNRLAYHKTRDKILFAEKLRSDSVDLKSDVESKSLNFYNGYLAMIADFIPFAFNARDDLELKLFMPDIKKRVAARKLEEKEKI